jgi:hypothetical protein
MVPLGQQFRQLVCVVELILYYQPVGKDPRVISITVEKAQEVKYVVCCNLEIAKSNLVFLAKNLPGAQAHAYGESI